MSDRPPATLEEVAAWLSAAGRAVDALHPLAGDVSTRRYVRLLAPSGDSSIVAVYPPDDVDTGERFVRTTSLLQEAGIRVPEVHQWDRDAGLMLLEDAGVRTAHEESRRGGDRLSFWKRAIDFERRIRELPGASVSEINTPLDGPMLRRELQQTWDLVLEPRGLTGPNDVAEELQLALFALCESLHEAPRTPGHRDLMARNFIVGEGGELVLIDHQDLRLAPDLYDLGSLLNDTLYASPSEEATLLAHARVERPAYESYHRAAAQRALKIAGTFAAFAARGSNRYLELVPPSLRAAERHLLRVPETAPVMKELAAAWGRELTAPQE